MSNTNIAALHVPDVCLDDFYKPLRCGTVSPAPSRMSRAGATTAVTTTAFTSDQSLIEEPLTPAPKVKTPLSVQKYRTAITVMESAAR